MRGLGIGVGAMLCVGLGASTAMAQAAPSAGAFGDGAAPAPSAATPKGAAPEALAPDVVRLKNGSFFRGQISELVPGDRVTIVIVTGDTRVFKMGEVSYAGSAARDPEAPAAQVAAPPPPSAQQGEPHWDQQTQQQPYVTVHAAEARIQFRSVEENTTFYRRSGSAYAEGHYGWTRVSAVSKGYERICTAPCEASLPSGRETIAYGHDNDEEPKELEPVTLPPGNSQLRLTFEEHPTRRTAGIVTIIAGPALAVTALFLFVNMACVRNNDPCSSDDEHKQAVLFGVGAVGLGVGLGLGIPLLKTSRDTPILETLPSDSAARRLDQARGLTLSGKF